MIEEVLSIFAAIGMALLIIAKGDKQFVHILEGKLYQSGKKQRVASELYQKHTNLVSLILFVVGISVLAIAVILFAKDNCFSILAFICGLALFGCGAWGRIRSFMAAARELDEIEDVHRNKVAR